MKHLKHIPTDELLRRAKHAFQHGWLGKLAHYEREYNRRNDSAINVRKPEVTFARYSA